MMMMMMMMRCDSVPVSTFQASLMVMHVRNVGHEISEKDLLDLFQSYGVISKLVMLRAKNQALIQMQDVASAVSAIQFYEKVQPNIRYKELI
ncbi:hypothetical protein RIF29_15874 [Crotalaria pallida]|uniref:RRM domain-containing protein n=1 Tax=Crotalaria pallida TaxID=3830 RepID=A0AAN9FFI5_CROPI